ncbi:hypothetical protein NDA11_000026 [Ustilago hordei]|nr:hypothetical protein NDA11_000026 [Ustilago hordei]KAJ1595498.1 hypothetical protein NDA14_007543 [Ustilago hordei]UTT89101.1 hypothetical protein NDA17_002280 [Ustilago hordei]
MSCTIPIRTNANANANANANGNGNGNATSSSSGTGVGTPRISYSRDQLLSLASSPLSRSAPTFLTLPAEISKVGRKPTSTKLNGDDSPEPDSSEDGDQPAFRLEL